MNTSPLFLSCLVAVGIGCLFTPTSALVCPTGDVGEVDESAVVSGPSPPGSADVSVDTEESNEGNAGGNGVPPTRLRRNAPDAGEDAGEDVGESGSGSEDNSRRVAIKVHGQSGKFSM